MNNLSRPMAEASFTAQLAEMIADDGTAAHPYCAPAVAGDRQSFVRSLVDFADFVHLVTLLHGQMPGLIDLAANHTVEVPARAWLLQAIDNFSAERRFLGKLVVAVGPLPSTSGQDTTTTIITQQRHAIEMLAQSDRRGCSLGAALTLVLDWRAIRNILDAGSIRLGIEPPPCNLPDRSATLAMLDALPNPHRLSRAILFGSTQLLEQHRGMWDLLQARADIRQPQF